MKKEKDEIPKPLFWLFSFLLIFSLILLAFNFGKTQGSFLSTEFNLKEGSVKFSVESENDNFILQAVYALFATVVILGIIYLVNNYIKYRYKKH